MSQERRERIIVLCIIGIGFVLIVLLLWQTKINKKAISFNALNGSTFQIKDTKENTTDGCPTGTILRLSSGECQSLYDYCQEKYGENAMYEPNNGSCKCRDGYKVQRLQQQFFETESCVKV